MLPYSRLKIVHGNAQELSLLEYRMLQYKPSTIAAAAMLIVQVISCQSLLIMGQDFSTSEWYKTQSCQHHEGCLHSTP